MSESGLYDSTSTLLITYKPLVFRDGPSLLIILLSVSDLIIYLCCSHDLFIMLDHSITSNNTLPILYTTLSLKVGIYFNMHLV